jgi:hypothetical protein
MNVQKSIKVLKWVEANLSAIQADRPTQTAIAQQATEALGFKVSTGPIKHCLEEFGITTRRVSKAQAKIDGLQRQLAQLETLLTKLIAAPELPNWLRDELENAELPPEAKAALARMENRQRESVAA